MTTNTNLKLTVEAWAEIVIKEWRNKIIAMDILDSYRLGDSLAHHIISSAGGDAQRIEFAFNYYGKFIDMGVGNGVKYEYRGDSDREPREWYLKTLYYHTKRLQEILVEKYQRKGAVTIVANIEDNSEVWKSTTI